MVFHKKTLGVPIPHVLLLAQYVGASAIITFEFGKHIDIYLGNLEGHGSPNPLEMKLENSGFGGNCSTGCPKNHLVQFLD